MILYCILDWKRYSTICIRLDIILYHIHITEYLAHNSFYFTYMYIIGNINGFEWSIIIYQYAQSIFTILY